MTQFFKLVRTISAYRVSVLLAIIFHVFVAIFTVASIPLVVPFFQLLFDQSEVIYAPPQRWWDLASVLNYSYAQLIERVDRIVALQWVCVAVVIVFLGKNICRFLISYFMIPVRNGILSDIRHRIWSTFQRLSISDRDHLQQGFLNSLITNDISEVDHGILKSFEMLFKLPLIVFGSIVFMLMLNVTLTCLAFGLILFTVVIVGRLSHSLKQPSSTAQESLARISTLVDQYLSSLKLVRSLGLESFFTSSFKRENQKYLNATNQVLIKRDLASPLSEFLGVVTIVVLLYVGTLMVLQKEMSANVFFAFIFAFYNIIDPAKSFSREYANVQRGLASLDRINGFCDTILSPESKADDASTVQPLTFAEEIHLHQVVLQYDGQVALSDVDLSIRKSEKIGLVGFSGAGKSSLIDVILRFYIPQDGHVYLDGVPIENLDIGAYRSLFGLVAQEPLLFQGSVRDNIILNEPLDVSKLSKIMNVTNLDMAILDYQVGDRGVMLSGGQRQRICIARALYREPQILILDEPTSELDAKNEREVHHALLNVLQGSTIILISHNIDLLEVMDRIVVLDHGRIEAIGTYDQLIKSSSIFPQLLRNDFK